MSLPGSLLPRAGSLPRRWTRRSRSCCGGSSRSAWVRMPGYGWPPAAGAGRKSAIECCAARESDDATPEDIRSTYLEIVNQSLSGVASAVSTRARKEISCLEGRSAAPPAVFPGASAFAFEISLGEQGFPLLAVFAPSITNLSDAPEQPQPKTAPEDRASRRPGC